MGKKRPYGSRVEESREVEELVGLVNGFDNIYTLLTDIVQTLTCSLCKNIMVQPSTFSTCGHTFCRECVVGTLEGKGIVSSLCPECKQPAWKKDLQTNHLMMNLIAHIKKMMQHLAEARLQEREKIQMQSRSKRQHKQQYISAPPKEVHSVEQLDKSPIGHMKDDVDTIEELKNQVSLLDAVLELCSSIPVSRLAATVDKHGDTRSHQMIQKALSVVPDSQDESQSHSISEHHPKHVEYGRKRDNPNSGMGVLKERTTNIHRNSTDAPAVKDMTERSKSSPLSNTVRRMWWKAKPRGRDGPIRMVLDLDSIDDKAHVQELVDNFAATFGEKVSVERNISRETTHVVVGTDSSLVARATPKFLQACTVGCWVVSFLWIDASIQNNGTIVEEKNYQIHGHKMNNNDSICWSLPENSRLRAIAGKRGIFDGMVFIIQQSKSNSSLVRLVELADGKVLRNVPTASSNGRYIALLSSSDCCPEEYSSQCEWVLDEKWVYDCVGSGKILSKEMYSVQ